MNCCKISHGSKFLFSHVLFLFFVIILFTCFQRASHPVIGAPRRLLQFAVRDAVRTLQPVASSSESASKRLRSVVSTLASDSTLDITHIRLQKTNSDLKIPGATAALRAAAEAAEDALKDSFSGSVFSRLGRMPTINSNEESLARREKDPEGEEYENIDNMQGEKQVDFYERNQHGGGDAYMRDRRTEEATGSTPNIDESDHTSSVRYNVLGSRRSALTASGESLVLGYKRGASEVRSGRLIAHGIYTGSRPRPSEKILNVSGHTSTQKLPTHETRDVPVDPQVPMAKKVADARNSHVKISHANDMAMMTDKSKVSFLSVFSKVSYSYKLHMLFTVKLAHISVHHMFSD